MKKIIFLILTLIIASCSEKKDVLEIPLTSDSPEAISILSEELFFKTNKIPSGLINRFFNPDLYSALKNALEIDPNFVFAKALLAYADDQLTRSDMISLLDESFKARNSVSDIEKGLIEAIYFYRVNGDKVKAAQILDKLVNNNPEYYYLRLFNGNYKNFVMLDPKSSESNWKEALKINPNADIAKILLAQLHFVTTPNFVLLESDEIDLDFAKKMIKEVEKNKPNSSTPQRLLGNVYRVEGEFDSSLQAYESAMKLIEDKNSSLYGNLLLISGHVYLFKGEYERAREYYKKSTENGSIGNIVNILAWSSNSYLYEKQYDKALISISELEKMVSKYDLDPLTKNNLLFRCAQEKFIAYGHSQMKNETKQVVKEIKELEGKIKSIRLENVSSESEKRNIELQSELNQAFFEIWYNILFGEYQVARESLRNFSLLSSEFLSFDSKAMINFYKLSGYLNLMEGNINQSISFYEQIPTELLEGDNYQLYFYALAKKANGNTKKSNELFHYLANYNFAGWENSIIRPLAKNQIKG